MSSEGAHRRPRLLPLPSLPPLRYMSVPAKEAL
jgi:hypothetical protein